jgi:tyrosyl-tRNA synthetase
MSTTRRMRELAATGFRPVALVGWDVHSSELGLLVDDSISHDMRSRLAEEAGAIFKTALDQVAMDPSVSKTQYMN